MHDIICYMDVTCNTCGKTFAAKRSDARYCSGQCRTRAHRVRNSPDESKRPRVPLPKLFRNAVTNSQSSVERLERLANDDRFARNRKPLAEVSKSRIRYQIEVLQKIHDQLEGK